MVNDSRSLRLQTGAMNLSRSGLTFVKRPKSYVKSSAARLLRLYAELMDLSALNHPLPLLERYGMQCWG
jgi:hypothetical protein